MTDRYFSAGRMVWRRPEKIDGALVVGYPVLIVHEACADQAETVAELLNAGERAAPHIRLQQTYGKDNP